MVETGEAAPDIELTADDDSTVRLKDFEGDKNVVLAFYPFAFSPTCTNELEGLGEVYDELQGLDTEVFGVSVDSKWSQARFREELGLPFRLLSDFDRTESPKLDALFEDKGFNRRVVTIVDKAGNVAYQEEFEPATCPDAKQILQKVQEINR